MCYACVCLLCSDLAQAREGRDELIRERQEVSRREKALEMQERVLGEQRMQLEKDRLEQLRSKQFAAQARVRKSSLFPLVLLTHPLSATTPLGNPLIFAIVNQIHWS